MSLIGYKRLLLLGASPLCGLVFAGGLFYFLEQHAAYQSPIEELSGTKTRTPRHDAEEDLEKWARARAEETARLAELMENLTTEKMVGLGKGIVFGRGLCLNCHKIGDEGRGTQGPNLQGVGGRASTRVEGMGNIAYLAQSLYNPDAFIVPGFAPAMTAANQPPIGLEELDILMVIAYLQSLGGEPTVTPDTKLR